MKYFLAIGAIISVLSILVVGIRGVVDEIRSAEKAICDTIEFTLTRYELTVSSDELLGNRYWTIRVDRRR